MAKNETRESDIQLLKRLQSLFIQTEVIVDELCKRGIKLRLQVGQETAIEKVLHEYSTKPTIIQITEAIKHTTLLKVK